MIVISDTIHNFVDGIAIAAGFLISPMSGFVTTVAVATHEIPQEIGEFALLFQKKLAKKKIILVGLLSSLATTLSAVIFYYLGNAANLSLAPLLGLVAGFFIYLAVGDIIPSINQEKDFSVRFKKVIILLISTVVMSFIITSLHEVAHH